MLKRNFIAIVFFIVTGFSFVSAKDNEDNISHRIPLNFKILESEYAVGKYIIGDSGQLKFVNYNWCKTPKTLPDSNRMLTLKAKFVIRQCDKFDDLYLAATPVNYACNIYLNGHLLATRGNLDRRASSRIGHSHEIYLIPTFLNIHNTNEIAFQLYPHYGENDPFNKVFISSNKEVCTYIFKRNMFGVFAYQAITVCSSIIFIYYFLLFFFQRDYHKKHYLFFSLINLCFVFMSLNSFMDYDYSDTYLYERIVRSSICVWSFFMIAFLVHYINFFKRSQWIISISACVYVSLGMYVFFQPNTVAILKAFNSFPSVFVFIGILVQWVITILYLNKEKSVKALVLFFVYLSCIIAAGYDIFNFSIIDRLPYAWFAPYAIFFSNISLFLLLAIEQAKVQRQLIIKADELKFSNENLDVIVKERTHQLKKLNATKDKFFSIIAHDLRNPFNALIGISRLSLINLNKKEYKPLEEQLAMIHDASKNAYALLENLLMWSRSQTNTIEFEPELLNLRTLSKESIENIISQSSSKEIHIVNEISENHIVYVDKNTMLTVFRNLLSNAVKYSYSKGIITLRSFDMVHHIQIEVIDNGTGIEPLDLRKLFKIETKVSVQGTNDEVGTGLGLILCKEFVVKNGGDIWVESVEGRGSTFKFTLPKNK